MMPPSKIATFTASSCSLSWIDGRTKLPEQDGNGPPPLLKGVDLTKEDDTLPFRFLNLAEASIAVDGATRRILTATWSTASKIYRNPSFGKIPSEPFDTQQSIARYPDRVVFQQTAGARTVSPEII